MERLFRFLPLRPFISQINTLYTKLADYPGAAAAASRAVSIRVERVLLKVALSPEEGTVHRICRHRFDA